MSGRICHLHLPWECDGNTKPELHTRGNLIYFNPVHFLSYCRYLEINQQKKGKQQIQQQIEAFPQNVYKLPNLCSSVSQVQRGEFILDLQQDESKI